MSWIEKIQEPLKIITGDQKEYTVLWKNAKKTLSFNTKAFNFSNVDGTLVKRLKSKSNNYSVEFFIQGNDHLEQAARFEESTRDQRHWHIIHPFYGDIRVQPSTLSFDNGDLNVTKITGTLLGTLPGVFPTAVEAPIDDITESKEISDASSAVAYANNNPTPTPSDVKLMNDTVDIFEASTEKIITDDDEFAEFKNNVSKARTAISNAIGEPLAAIRATQAVVNYPFQVTASIKERFNTLEEEFETLTNSILNVVFGEPSVSERRYYESISTALIGAMCLVSIDPSETDYKNRNDVDFIIGRISANYLLYLDNLDSIQTDTGGDLDSYIPDSEGLADLEQLVFLTQSKLFDIALDSRQERKIFLEEDSDIIKLTHRFYGLDEDDENIGEFIKNNNIGLNEHLVVKKGREITYYV